ncbi:hypothetical protein L2E82_27490 [Cichorium intybus]|uniref:Uncharacterized protein n=1 Tax=Cichorium intybus TaxID=13427 RepID=A0ACB9CTC8_CICIN|nr:hypothetical protein L2E82_27490 [Cichorium intybus]
MMTEECDAWNRDASNSKASVSKSSATNENFGIDKNDGIKTPFMQEVQLEIDKIDPYVFIQYRSKEHKSLIANGITLFLGAGAIPKLVKAAYPEVLDVLLDGCVVSAIPTDRVEKAVNHLRKLKLSTTSVIPEDLEVGCIEIECLHGADGGGLKEFPALMRKFIQLEHLVLLIAKQTMRFSSQGINCRADQKLYHLQVLRS